MAVREKVNAIVDSFVFGQVYDQFGEEIEERALTKVVIETPFQEQISSKFWGERQLVGNRLKHRLSQDHSTSNNDKE